MSAVVTRTGSRGWSSAQRAEVVARFHARIAAREAADPVHPYKLLFSWADPSCIRAINTMRMVNGRVVGLAEHHELMRRCFVLLCMGGPQGWLARGVLHRSWVKRRFTDDLRVRRAERGDELPLQARSRRRAARKERFMMQPGIYPVEHKTTSYEIGPGSPYSEERLTLDSYDLELLRPSARARLRAGRTYLRRHPQSSTRAIQGNAARAAVSMLRSRRTERARSARRRTPVFGPHVEMITNDDGSTREVACVSNT